MLSERCLTRTLWRDSLQMGLLQLGPRTARLWITIGTIITLCYYIYLYLSLSLYEYMYAYIYIYIHIYIYIYTHTHTRPDLVGLHPNFILHKWCEYPIPP